MPTCSGSLINGYKAPYTIVIVRRLMISKYVETTFSFAGCCVGLVDTSIYRKQEGSGCSCVVYNTESGFVTVSFMLDGHLEPPLSKDSNLKDLGSTVVAIYIIVVCPFYKKGFAVSKGVEAFPVRLSKYQIKQ